MPKWRGSAIHGDHGCPDRRGNGSTGRRNRRGPHGLRYVQSPRQRYGNHGHRSHGKDRREQAGLPPAKGCPKTPPISTPGAKKKKLLLARDKTPPPLSFRNRPHPPRPPPTPPA